jgi:hypothetical protein
MTVNEKVKWLEEGQKKFHPHERDVTKVRRSAKKKKWWLSAGFTDPGLFLGRAKASPSAGLFCFRSSVEVKAKNGRFSI